jgi:AbrB family looped-hinge helix DNA binding protein
VSKVTSKRQITIPKHLADQYGIEPGDDIAWQADGAAIRIAPGRLGAVDELTIEERAKLFDAATDRQRKRSAGAAGSRRRGDRGWTREELYDRGVPR